MHLLKYKLQLHILFNASHYVTLVIDSQLTIYAHYVPFQKHNPFFEGIPNGHVAVVVKELQSLSSDYYWQIPLRTPGHIFDYAQQSKADYPFNEEHEVN